MKKLVLVLATGIILFSCSESKKTEETNTYAVNGTTAKATFKVWGNCGMCKKTIESSLQAEGINEADWNKDTKIISVSFDTTMFNLDQIQKRIADAGYDNVKYKGDDLAYSNLHECCHYERK